MSQLPGGPLIEVFIPGLRSTQILLVVEQEVVRYTVSTIVSSTFQFSFSEPNAIKLVFHNSNSPHSKYIQICKIISSKILLFSSSQSY